MNLDPKIVAAHKQLDCDSCIPMAVEFVLKLCRRIPPDNFDFQQEWKNRQEPREKRNFGLFDGKILYGLRFRRQGNTDRGSHFDLDGLFRIIKQEVNEGRYVIISLWVPNGWHNFIIYDELPNGEFSAVTKGRSEGDGPFHNIRERVRRMQGTDILTYEVVDAGPAEHERR